LLKQVSELLGVAKESLLVFVQQEIMGKDEQKTLGEEVSVRI
jgi:hypothetical protein